MGKGFKTHKCSSLCSSFYEIAAAFCRTEAKGFVKGALSWIGLFIKATDMEEIENILRPIVIITMKQRNELSKNSSVQLIL